MLINLKNLPSTAKVKSTEWSIDLNLDHGSHKNISTVLKFCSTKQIVNRLSEEKLTVYFTVIASKKFFLTEDQPGLTRLTQQRKAS